MKWLRMIFGLLDLGIIAVYAARMPGYARGFADQPWLSGTCLVVMATLLASGYGLLRGRTWALVLNYLQFPFRIGLGFLSFAWMAELIVPATASPLLHQSVWISAVALEGVRLGLTIMLHRKG